MSKGKKIEVQKGLGKKMPGLILYVCLSALGLTLIKIGLNQQSTLLLDKSGFTLTFSWILVGGIVLYIISFLTSLIVMKGMNLSIYYPLSAGLIYIIVCLLSVLMLKEKVSTSQLIGMAVILAGIVIMNIGRTK